MQYDNDNDCSFGIYQHYKGKHYQVLGVARSSEDPMQEFVVYKALHHATLDEDGTELPVGSLWIRPKSMFIGECFDGDGKSVKRFKKIIE